MADPAQNYIAGTQPTTQVYSAPGFFSRIGKLKALLLLILVLSLVGAGFVGGSYYQTSQKNSAADLVRSSLPIPYSIIANPIFTEFRAGFDGKVTSKTETTVTVEKDGNEITANVGLPASLMYDSTSGAPKQITLADIKIGATVRGYAFLPQTRTPTTNPYKDQILISSLEVYKN